jgi:hypothetical protein
MAVNLTHAEREVLKKYVELSKEDPEGSWNPYFIDVAQAAGGDADLAYSICKRLKKAMLLEHHGAAGRSLAASPGYWPTEAGEKLIADLEGDDAQ